MSGCSFVLCNKPSSRAPLGPPPGAAIWCTGIKIATYGVVTLEFVGGAVSAVGVPRRAVPLVTRVPTVSVTVTHKVSTDTVVTGTPELTSQTGALT